MYAGFVTRAVALMLDIVLIVVGVLVINALIGLPVAFFTGINLNNCAQNDRSTRSRQSSSVPRLT